MFIDTLCRIRSFVSDSLYNRVHEEARALKRGEKRFPSVLFILAGVVSIIWLAMRSGRKPSRLTYPCQQACTGMSAVFFSWIAGLFLAKVVYPIVRPSRLLVSGIVIVASLMFISVSAFSAFRAIRSRILNAQSVGGISRVVWVYDPRAATGWSSNYASRVDAAVAEEMMDLGIRQLTGQSNLATAWQGLFTRVSGHAYRNGEKIAVKVNFNNSGSDNNHNPNFQVVNALLRQLIDVVGVTPADIILYDASRPLSNQFRSGIQSKYPGVSMNPSSGFCGSTVWSGPGGSARLTCVLQDATYLINIPLLRTHDGAGSVTLNLKNHLGSTDNPAAFHYGLSSPYNGSYSLIALNRQTWIGQKTMISIGDGIYGLKSAGPSASPDSSNGIIPYPSSLFFSTDVIANDSVMIDYISTKNNNSFRTDYRALLRTAAQAGLGTYETAYPSMQYNTIQLIKCVSGSCSGGGALPTPTPTQAGQPTPTRTPTPTQVASPTPTRTPTPTQVGQPTPTRTPTSPPGATATPTPPSQPGKPGDANGDGKVDGVDYTIWLNHYLLPSTQGAQDGDFNADGKVDGVDYSIWLKNYLT